MKIKYVSWRGDVEFDSVKEAAQDALTPDAYSYDGQLEGLSVRIDKLQEILAALISHSKLNAVELQDILGYGYEIEE